MNLVRLFSLSRQRVPLTLFTTVRSSSYSQHIKFHESQDRWREKDGLSKNWQLIYKGPHDKTFNFLTAYITFSTAFIGVSALYVGTFVIEPGEFNSPVLLGEDVVISNDATESLVYITAFIVLHLAVKLLISRYVLRMYKDGDNYLAVFRGHMYNSINTHQFKLEDFKRLKTYVAVTWPDARFALGTKHAVILEHYFKTPEYFNYLLNKKKAVSSEDNEMEKE